jgi:hypothetical protein
MVDVHISNNGDAEATALGLLEAAATADLSPTVVRVAPGFDGFFVPEELATTLPPPRSRSPRTHRDANWPHMDTTGLVVGPKLTYIPPADIDFVHHEGDEQATAQALLDAAAAAGLPPWAVQVAPGFEGFFVPEPPVPTEVLFTFVLDPPGPEFPRDAHIGITATANFPVATTSEVHVWAQNDTVPYKQDRLSSTDGITWTGTITTDDWGGDAYTIWVSIKDGQPGQTMDITFVDPSLTLTSMTPNTGSEGLAATYTVVGTELTQGTRFQLVEQGVSAWDIVPIGLTDTGFTFEWTFGGGGDGVYDLAANYPDGVASIMRALTIVPGVITTVTPATAPDDVMTSYTATGTGLAGVTKAQRRFVGGDGSWGDLSSFASQGDTGFSWRGQHSGPNVVDIRGVDAGGAEVVVKTNAITIGGTAVITAITPEPYVAGLATLYTVVGTELPDTITKVAFVGNPTVPITAGSLTPTGFTFTATLALPTDTTETHLHTEARTAADALVAAYELAVPWPPVVLTTTVTPAAIYKGETFTVDITADVDPAQTVMVQLSSTGGSTWQDNGVATEVTPTTFTRVIDTDTWTPKDGIQVRAVSGDNISNVALIDVKATPTLTSIVPVEADSADETTYTLVGTGLGLLTKVRFTSTNGVNNDIVLASNDGTTATVVATLAASVYDVRVINDDASVAAGPLNDVLTVVTVPAAPPAPVFDPPSPAAVGTPTLTVTVTLTEAAPAGWDIVSAHRHDGAGPWQVRLHTPNADRTVWTLVITITDHNQAGHQWEFMAAWSNGDVTGDITVDEFPDPSIVDNYGPSAFWEIETPPPPPTITAVTPAENDTGGLDPVTITGTGFIGATTAYIDMKLLLDFVVVNDTTITATTPASLNTPGVKDVLVGHPNGNATGTGLYTVVEAPDGVTGVTPNTATESGNLNVTVHGSGFTGATGVMFGSFNGTNFQGNSNTSVMVKTPDMPPGTGAVTVTVKRPNGDLSLPNGFTFTPGGGEELGDELAITEPVDGAEVDPLVTIRGTAPAGSTVDLYMDSSADGTVPVSSVTADENGAFEFAGTTPMEVSPEGITVGVGDERSSKVTVTIAAPAAAKSTTTRKKATR